MDSSDIKWKLTGGASNTDPKESRGGARNASANITSPYAIFDNASSAENASGNVDEYRCIVLKNDHATHAMINLSMKIQGTANSPALVAVAWETSDNNYSGDENSYRSKTSSESDFSTTSYFSAFVSSVNGALSASVSPVNPTGGTPVYVRPGSFIRIWIKRRIGGNETANTKTAKITITSDWYVY